MDLSPRFSTLPWELVECIIKAAANDWCITQPGMLARLCPLSRAMRKLCTPLLYSTVAVHGLLSVQLFFRTVESFPDGFLARHLTATSLSFHEGESWTPVGSTLATFASMLAIVSYAQAPVDLFDYVLDTDAWSTRAAPLRGMSMSLLPPTRSLRMTPHDYIRVLLNLLTKAQAKRIHIGGSYRLFRMVLLSISTMDTTDKPAQLTHIACDVTDARVWSHVTTKFAVTNVMAWPGFECMVLRIGKTDGHTSQLLELLKSMEDPRIHVHYVPDDEVQSSIQRRHMAGIDDLWLSGEPVYVPPNRDA
ncbi:hypothetical protein BKA62DRAFT_502682 [Auriculariales sp. MPI-PUGE-AT-0066]|nr:hypothetical protein BKA62DRAFT_502682 [Auriculariales sp. MPI-PUGE-AT-0066]